MKHKRLILYSLKGKSHRGLCPICESKVFFVKKGDWLRDDYLCYQCNFIPRQLAITIAINLFAPEWKNLRIHESSPSSPSSAFIKKNCSQYVPTQFFQDTPLGNFINAWNEWAEGNHLEPCQK